MKIRIFSMTMLAVFFSFHLSAQESKPVHINQVGINFNSLYSFGIHYKTGSEKTLLRLSLLTLNMSNDSRWGRTEDSIDSKGRQYGAGFRIGFEKHIPVATNFRFIWGAEAGCNYDYSKQKRNVSYDYSDYEITDWRVTPLVNLILGVTYTIADHLVLGAEITPGFQYSFGKTTTSVFERTTEEKVTQFAFGFNNNSANLSLAYRFGK